MTDAEKSAVADRLSAAIVALERGEGTFYVLPDLKRMVRELRGETTEGDVDAVA